MYSPSHLEVAILNYLNENDITVPIKGVLQETINVVKAIVTLEALLDMYWGALWKNSI